MSHIFISYTEEDSSVAFEIASALESEGYSTWLYERDSVPGPAYLIQMGEAIDSCQAILLIISPNSVESNQVTTEVVRGHEEGKPFIPVLLGISHSEFQQIQPLWRQVLGASTSISVTREGVSRAVSRVVEGLRALSVEPSGIGAGGDQSSVTTTREVFVGREREIDELRTALDDVLAGRGRLVMLVGEPGIGKTRLAQEFSLIAERRGAQVFWGRSYEGQGAPPFWPWIQPLQAYVQQSDADSLRSQMGPRAADIAELIPDIREKLPELEPPPTLEPEQARFRLFDSITTFLKNASQKQPMTLILDNLHLADTSSLLLLEFLTSVLENSHLLVIGTYRDVELTRGHPLTDTMARLSRDHGFTRMLLKGLSQHDISNFITASTSEILVSDNISQDIYTHSEGNPFFITEFVRLLVDEGGLSNRGAQGLKIPEGVREVIGQRLNRLSDECNNVLITASIIGREFKFTTLENLMDNMSENDLLDAVDEALGAHLIEEVDRETERYRFRNALTKETLSSELSARRRTRLHARIAEILEDLYRDDADKSATELAYHYGEAQTVLGVEKLIRYSKIAGEQALATYAYEEALVHFKRAWAAREDQPMDAESASILFDLGRAQMAMNDGDEARASLTKAFNYHSDMGNVDQALAIVEALPPGSGLLGMTELTTRALEMTAPDSLQAASLLSRQGLNLGRQQGDYEGAQEALSNALSIAQREGDIALELRILANAADVYGWHLHLQESLNSSLQAIDLASQFDDLYAQSLAQGCASLVLSRTGDSAGASSHAAAALTAAERLRDRHRLARALHFNMNVARLLGDWQTARAYSNRALEITPSDYDHLLQRALFEYEVGEFEAAEAFLDRLINSVNQTAISLSGAYSYLALGIPLIGRITDTNERFDVAESAAERILSLPYAMGKMAVHVGLALMSIQRGDSAAASEQYSAVGTEKGTLTSLFTSPALAGSHLLGLLAKTMGNLNDAQAHFEDAITFCRKAGYRPELAWTLCDYADLLVERDGITDRYAAVAFLEESKQISTELEMKPLMGRVISRSELLKA